MRRYCSGLLSTEKVQQFEITHSLFPVSFSFQVVKEKGPVSVVVETRGAEISLAWLAPRGRSQARAPWAQVPAPSVQLLGFGYASCSFSFPQHQL